jgi:putative membrane protein insertion efficiency factor
MGYCDSSANDSRNGGVFDAGGRAGEINSAHTVTSSHWDSGARNRRSAGAWVLLALVQFYRTFLSHFFGGACKFYPSCSKYAQEAITRHGARRGVVLALKRLGRCRPFTKGGFDPVPDKEEGTTSGSQITLATNSTAWNLSQGSNVHFTENALSKQDKELVL